MIAALLGSVILANVVAMMIETMAGLPHGVQAFLAGFELFSLLLFTLEYLLRLWVAPEDPDYQTHFGRLRWMATPMALIDLAVLVPFFLPMFMPIDLRSLRALRLLRVLRLLKFQRYSDAVGTLGRVVAARRGELAAVALIVAVMLVVLSTLIYHAEHEAQPDMFPDIPSSLWWAIITLTTIGYGDVYPVTTLGKVVGGIAALTGVGLVTLPAGILATGFFEEVRRGTKCPHCGHDLHAP